jgi:hypothetical protein
MKLSPGDEILCSPLHSSKHWVFTPGVERRVNMPPKGQISPLVAKFTPRGKVHPWGPGVKLRMALWFVSYPFFTFVKNAIFRSLWKLSFCKTVASQEIAFWKEAEIESRSKFLQRSLTHPSTDIELFGGLFKVRGYRWRVWETCALKVILWRVLCVAC